MTWTWLLLNCKGPTITSLPFPISVKTDGDVIMAQAATRDQASRFALLVDTGTPITAYTSASDPSSVANVTTRLDLYSSDADGIARQRVTFDGVSIFTAPLGKIAYTDASPVDIDVKGIFGGDLLRNFIVRLDYKSPATSTITLATNQWTCACQLGEEGHAVFPFSLLGGQQTLVLSGDLFLYPPTRVYVDACLEPTINPLPDAPCVSDDSGTRDSRYRTAGVDVRLLVATGFPGLALGQNVYSRLLHDPPTEHRRLILPDNKDGPGLDYAIGSLGTATTSALALVSRELVLGPCAELARSRRLRRIDSTQKRSDSVSVRDTKSCLTKQACEQTLAGCNDRGANAAAIVELQQAPEIWVVEDTVPLLQRINADIQPGQATIEGIIGGKLLKQLALTIDYPNQRVSVDCCPNQDNRVHCDTLPGCYPRFIPGQTDCDGCSKK